jgi:hypothetical protein
MVTSHNNDEWYPSFAKKQCSSAKLGIALQCSNVSEQDCLLEK